MNLNELQALAASVGFPDANLAAAVAMAESGGDPQILGDVEYGGSIGLWQINLPSNPQYDASALKDPTYNANAALAISKQGTNWNPWTTYRTGAYKRWYPGPPTAGPSKTKAIVIGGVVVASAAGLAWWLTSGRYRYELRVPRISR